LRQTYVGLRNDVCFRNHIEEIPLISEQINSLIKRLIQSISYFIFSVKSLGHRCKKYGDIKNKQKTQIWRFVIRRITEV